MPLPRRPRINLLQKVYRLSKRSARLANLSLSKQRILKSLAPGALGPSMIEPASANRPHSIRITENWLSKSGNPTQNTLLPYDRHK